MPPFFFNHIRLLCCLGFLLASSSIALAKGSFAIKPAASWVRNISADSTVPAEAGSSSTFILDDHQVRVGNGTADRYYHHVHRIESAAGLDDLSQLRFYFEPSYQQLTIHFIKLVRDKEIINALKPSEIKIIQQEEELDQQLFNGTLAALVFLNDLRAGDVIDYAYTVTGENPVLGGPYVETFTLADNVPIKHLTLRVLCPSQRHPAMKTSNIDIQPSIQTLGSDTEYFWERRDVAAISYEDDTPDWFDPYPRLILSEFQTWADVVNWGAPLYRLPATQPPKLAAKIEEWKARYSMPGERAIAALRFVQDEIRYLGIELDRYSHQPTSPDKVFARRFGDCKDKSLLLSSILNSMGIQAAPALVDTSAGRSLDNVQPSPYAFDHVIVKALIDGKTYWFDATRSYQRGQLSRYYDPPYERALVLQEGNQALEIIPTPARNSGSVAINEIYKATDSMSQVDLTVITTYQGSEADYMRYDLSMQSLADLGKSYLNYYADENPSISAQGLPQVNDDQTNNKIVVEEKYRILDFWKDAKHRFVPDRISVELSKPRVSQRSRPLSVRYPLSIKHTTLIDLSEHYQVRPGEMTLSDDSMSFDYNCSTQGNTIRIEYALNTLADSVPLEKVQKHLQMIDRIHNVLGFELGGGRQGFAFEPRSRASNAVLSVLLIILLPVVAAVSILAIRRRRRFEGRAQTMSAQPQIRGGTPESAIKVVRESEIDEILASFNCRCGQKPYRPEAPPEKERFVYDGERLVGVRLQCSSCRQYTDLYFQPPGPKQDVVELGINSANSFRQ